MKFISILLLLIVPLFIQSQNLMKAPISEIKTNPSTKDVQNNPIMYDLYKRYVSPIDDDRCIMYPSCSTFAKEAMAKYDFAIGFLYTTDRLTRCGNDLIFYKKIFINKRIHFIDKINKQESNYGKY